MVTGDGCVDVLAENICAGKIYVNYIKNFIELN